MGYSPAQKNLGDGQEKDFKIENENVCYEFPDSGLLNIKLMFKEIESLKQSFPIILEEVNEKRLLDVKERIEKYAIQ